jgi:transcriptional regulator with PAS, ATPase and Fis domain
VEDIPLLAAHFMAKHSARCGKSIDPIADDLMSVLIEYHWPGNVRELENTIERAVVLAEGSTITRDALTMEVAATPTLVVPSLRLRQNLEWVERETIRRALKVSSAKRQAAELMGISPRALSYYLAKYPFIDQHRHDTGGV